VYETNSGGSRVVACGLLSPRSCLFGTEGEDLFRVKCAPGNRGSW
jgi:hypothetical protein